MQSFKKQHIFSELTNDLFIQLKLPFSNSAYVLNLPCKVFIINNNTGQNNPNLISKKRVNVNSETPMIQI
jgi:hypothetical protein